MFREIDSDFNLDRHLIPFMQDVPFFAEISRRMRKYPSDQLPTAAVIYDPRTDDMTLVYNPKFMDTLTNAEIRGVLTHEFYHLIFGHLNLRRKTPPKLWNIATDLAINSVIVDNNQGPNAPRALPNFALIPGRRPQPPKGMKEPKESKDAKSLASIIEKLPTMQASEWYYSKLMQEAKDQGEGDGPKCPCCGGDFDPNGQPGGGKGDQGGQGDEEGDDGNGGGQGDQESQGGEGGSCRCPVCGNECQEGQGGGSGGWDIDSMDDHSGWDDIPEEQREYVEGKVRAIVESAVQAADQQSNGWGNIPANIRDEIRRSISTIVPWQAVLKQFIGTLNPGGRTTSIKRINRRYPYIHPGIKRARAPKLLIAIDESGSVGNEMLQMFFGELSTLTRKMDITIVPFDCDCRVEDCTEWRRGQPAPVAREKCGGTNFDAPTRMANDPKNRGRWDGMLIMTDGECSEPGPSRMKRGWVLGKGQKLYFDSNELQVFLDDAKPMIGAWR